MNDLYNKHYNIMINNPDDYICYCENQDILVNCFNSQIKYILHNILENEILSS